MTGKIAQRNTKVGDVLKNEYDVYSGYCREDVIVTVPAGGLQVGAVLESTSVAGKYTPVVVLTTANADGVLIDSGIYDLDTTAGGDFMLAVLVNGPAQVAKESLTYGADVDTGPEIDAVVAALTANTSIKTVTQV